MKRIALLALLAACVPATEETDPRGGLKVVTVPSAASRGEPFVTSDGWTIRIESLLVMASFIPSPLSDSAGEGSIWLFHASESIDAHLRAMPVGPSNLRITLGADPSDQRRAVAFKTSSITAEEHTLLRVGDTDCGSDETCRYLTQFGRGIPPKAHLVARAEKEGRILRIDTLLSQRTDDTIIPVDVVADVFTPLEVKLEAESLFKDNTGALTFDEIAAADANNDGRITAGELRDARAISSPPPTNQTPQAGPFPEGSLSVYTLLTRRADKLWRP